MSRIVRGWRSTFASKGIFAALPAPSTAERVDLLRAGADTVLDVLSPPKLAGAEVKAVLRRLRQPNGSTVITAQTIKTRSRLARSGGIILDCLFAGKGAPVPHAVVLARLGKDDDKAARAALRVQVCHLNGQLINAVIKSKRNCGLVIEARAA